MNTWVDRGGEVALFEGKEITDADFFQATDAEIKKVDKFACAQIGMITDELESLEAQVDKYAKKKKASQPEAVAARGRASSLLSQAPASPDELEQESQRLTARAKSIGNRFLEVGIRFLALANVWCNGSPPFLAPVNSHQPPSTPLHYTGLANECTHTGAFFTTSARCTSTSTSWPSTRS